MRNLSIVAPKGVAFLKVPVIADAAEFCAELRRRFPLKIAVQFAPSDECVEGAVSVSELLEQARSLLQKAEELEVLQTEYERAVAQVSPEDGALVIFTTGSTGSPKAALLSHRNISCQAMCLSHVLPHGSGGELVTLVNLPPSHVGCQTELLMSTIFDGGCAVLCLIRYARCAPSQTTKLWPLEAIVAFVEVQPGREIQVPQLERHARGLAAYMRPHHYVLLGPGQRPLNRVGKADYMSLRNLPIKKWRH